MRNWAVVVLFLMSTAVYAAENESTSTSAAYGEFQISPRLGRGLLRIDDEFVINRGDIEVDTADVGATFGYVAPFGLLIEIGALTNGNIDFWGATDQYTFSDRFLTVGYQFTIGRGIKLIPKVGRTRWKLDSEEGAWFNPGPEDRETARGYENFWEISLLKQVKPWMALGVTGKENGYEFGRVRSIAFTMTFGLTR